MILIIDNDRRVAQDLANMLYYMGFLCRAIKPAEFASTIAPKYRAIVLTEPSRLQSPVNLIETIRKYVGTTPIFAKEGVSRLEEVAENVKVYSKSSFASELSGFIADYCTEKYLPVPGRYNIAGLNVSVDGKSPTYFDRALPFTKTENMILRYLIRTSPTPTKPQDILKHAFRPSQMPELSNVRTHVSIINKKFRELEGKNLICSTPSGYKLTILISDEAKSK